MARLGLVGIARVIDPLQVTRDLIAIESITGNEEPVCAYLEAALRGMGLEVRSEEVAPGRRNLLALVPGASDPPGVLFSTHTDTVPPFVPLSEDDEFIYGRGACDTKGITACFLAAGERLLARGVRDFGYLFVVGEEVDNLGARAANRWVRARWLIGGEPTENRLARGHKGFLGVRVVAKGTACHSAYPHLGDSAVHRLVRALGRVIETDFGHDDILGPATVNVGTIRGGVAANVLAPEAEAIIAVRVVDSAARVEERLRAAFADPETGRPDERIEIDIRTRMDPMTFETIDGFETCIVSYGTDLPSLRDVGRLLLYGPGSIHDAHTAREKISKRSMERAIEDYVALAERLIG